MGLDTTHDCFHGSYVAFNIWRGELAKVVNIPLELMQGYYEPDATSPLTTGMPDFMLEIFQRRIFQWLPISWDILKGDALITLLNHSDCEGAIETGDCLPLAERLEEIAPLLPQDNRFDLKAATLTFAKGLRLAAKRGEKVTFR